MKKQETDDMHQTLDELDQILGRKMKENSKKRTEIYENEEADQSLLKNQHIRNEQMKTVNLDLRDLRQKKHTLTQQVESKRKLKEAMEEELANLASQLQESRSSTNVVRKKSVPSTPISNPFSTHFTTPPPASLETRPKFSFKKPQKPEGIISPVTPDVRLLKRKVGSETPDARELPSNDYNPQGKDKLSEFKTAAQMMKQRSQIPSGSNESQSTTFTFKKTRKN